MRIDEQFVRTVAEYFGVTHAIPVGGGTSGLFLAMKAAGVTGKKVIIPALTCPSVAVAALAAGGEPLIVDVSGDDCNLSVERVASALDDSVAAIVAVDAFGYPARIPELRKSAGRRGCVIIEDACQSYGGVACGIPLGGRGDIGVISFGLAKNVELRTGGFVLTDNDELAHSIARRLLAPDFAVLGYARRRMYQRFCSGHADILRYLSARTGLLRYRFPESQAERAKSAWQNFVGQIPQVRANLQDVRKELESWRKIETFSYEGDSWLPWRYSFSIPDKDLADRLTRLAPAHGLSFSHIYRPMDDYYPSLNAADSLWTAHGIAAHIYNLVYAPSQESTERLLASLQALRPALDV